MATDQSVLNYPTLSEVMGNYSSTDLAAQFIQAARILDRRCPLMKILPMIPSNNVLFNVATRTDSLPSPSTRRLNEPSAVTTSHNAPITDPTALFEDWSQVDDEILRIQNTPSAWRLDQDANHIEGFGQKIESTLLYGNLVTDPGSFNGLATRFNNLESYPNGDTSWLPNVWNNGATSGASTSMWIVQFGLKEVYGIYPGNTAAGLMVEDLGKETAEFPTSTGGGPMLSKMMRVWRTHFTWRLGLQIADERCIQRIANINPTPLSANNFDPNIIIAALDQLPSRDNAVIMVNRNLMTQINQAAVNQKLNAWFTQNTDTGDVWGRTVTRFQGVPIILNEKILNTETIIS